MPLNELLQAIYNRFNQLGEFELQDVNNEVTFPAIVLSDIDVEQAEDKANPGYIITINYTTGSIYSGKKETHEMLNYIFRVQNILDEEIKTVGDYKLDFIKILKLADIKTEKLNDGEQIIHGTASYSYYLSKIKE